MKKIIIGADRSGSGKTSITIGLLAALKSRKIRVRPYKVGPDYIDILYHKLVSGEYSYNLDSWILNENYLKWHFHETSLGYDMALIEGVMGLFDGKGEGIKGSTAEISIILQIPVILVVNCDSIAGSIAPLVYGYMNFDKRVKVVGVILNNVASQRHRDYLLDSLKSSNIPCYGAIYRSEIFSFKSRHLGLDTSIKKQLGKNKINEMARIIEKSLDIERIIKVASNSSASRINGGKIKRNGSEDYRSIFYIFQKKAKVVCRLAVAYDEAFHFYYRANLDLLRTFGAEIVEFSLLKDKYLPENVDGIYIGGGYPEIYADRLSKNKSMINSIREYALMGGVIYGECGGLMYLSDSIIYDGKKYKMVGLFNIDIEVCKKLFKLGYVEVQLSKKCILGEKGVTIRGHEFHYSKIVKDRIKNKEVTKGIYYLVGEEDQFTVKGYYYKRVLASYVHLHFGSNPEVANSLVKSCYESSKYL